MNFDVYLRALIGMRTWLGWGFLLDLPPSDPVFGRSHIGTSDYPRASRYIFGYAFRVKRSLNGLSA